ncbi:MAG: Polysaccharide biosynthesis protein [bacterium]|nr:Polysaccharide biosynthesis protein [bacterium]
MVIATAWGTVRRSRLARNSAHMFIGQLLRTAVQAVYFVLLARSLSPDGYGMFVGVAALVATVAPFAGLGGSNLLVKNVARDPSRASSALGNAWFLVGVSGTLLLSLVLATSGLLLPAGAPLLLAAELGISELLLARLLDVCGAAFQARQQVGRTSSLQLLLSLSRLTAIAVIYVAVRAPTPQIWGACYLVATLVPAVIAGVIVCRTFGMPRLDLVRLHAELGEGALFAVSLSAQTIYNDVDKTMLARSNAAAAGIYGAAYRIIDVSFAPVRAVLFAAYSRFFRDGARGLGATTALARRLAPPGVAYATLSACALIVAAPFLPALIGSGYADVVPALRWLAPLTILRSVHYFTADALTGAGRQGLRSALQLAVALVNVGLNLWLIPRYGWRGAAWASLACDGLLMTTLLLAVAVLIRRERAHA